MNESGRLLLALRKEGIPCKRIVVNQVRYSACSTVQAVPACMRALKCIVVNQVRPCAHGLQGGACPLHGPCTPGEVWPCSNTHARVCARACVQLVGPAQGDAFLRLKLKDQAEALSLIAGEPDLEKLNKVQHSACMRACSTMLHASAAQPGWQHARCAMEGRGALAWYGMPWCGGMVAVHACMHVVPQLIAPMVDVEVRGVPALQYFGNVVWGMPGQVMPCPCKPCTPCVLPAAHLAFQASRAIP